MRLGISYWFGYPSFPEERVQLLKEEGFSHVSLHWTDEYETVTGKKETAAILLRKNNIHISSFHLSFEQSHLLWMDSKDGELYRQNILNAIDEAVDFNVPTIVIHTDGTQFMETKVLFFLEPLVIAANAKNVNLCIENLQKDDNLTPILSHFNKGLSVCYDIGHANIRSAPIELANNKQIKYIHIHDNHGIFDDHLLPYEGTVKWDRVALAIRTLSDVTGILEVHENLFSRQQAKIYLQKVADCAMMLENNV